MLATWANLLTLIRLLLVWPIAQLMVEGSWGYAFALFWLSVATDLFDGPLARRLNQSSAFGGIVDHATDAIFVTVGCAVAASLDLITPVLAVLIPAAFLQYMIDSRVFRGRPLRGSALGKWNGVAYFVILGVVIGSHTLGWWAWFELPTQLFAWLLVVATLVSISLRARQYWLRTQ